MTYLPATSWVWLKKKKKNLNAGAGRGVRLWLGWLATSGVEAATAFKNAWLGFWAPFLYSETLWVGGVWRGRQEWDFLDNAGASRRFLPNTPGLKVTEPEPRDLVLVAHVQACPSQIYFGGMGGYELIAIPLLRVQNLKCDPGGHFYLRIPRPLLALLRLHVIGFFLLPPPPPFGLCSGLN